MKTGDNIRDEAMLAKLPEEVASHYDYEHYGVLGFRTWEIDNSKVVEVWYTCSIGEPRWVGRPRVRRWYKKDDSRGWRAGQGWVKDSLPRWLLRMAGDLLPRLLGRMGGLI